ncbi:hypothetical protein HYX01_04440 [Candidatus Woesearchaeota archaeon]|nr:hypothetical protein [Candidatus Woesearchaeota archaeon]
MEHDLASGSIQKTGSINQILKQILHHADTNRSIFELISDASGHILTNPTLFDGMVNNLIEMGGRYSTQIEDLRTVCQQIEQLRKLAEKQGYKDVLELLNKPLPYDRGYF